MERFFLKPQIYFGENSIDYLQTLNARKAYIVTDPFMVKLGIVDRIIKSIKEKNIDYEVFSEVEPNPSLNTAIKGLTHIINARPDLVVAVGGGSAIDAAKAMIYFCIKTKERLVDISSIKKPWFVAIPTTSGTGSEVTSYSVITDTQNHQKIPLSNEFMMPDAAVLDYTLTKTVPTSVTADTGMDVLTHGIEAYVSNQSTDFSDLYAEKAINLVFKYLLRAYENIDDTARMKMHYASCMAGVAFQNSSLGINHSIAHSIGARFNISHGRSNAMLLPYVIRHNSDLDICNKEYTYSSKKYAKISSLIGFPASNVKEGVISLCEAINYLNKKMGIPRTFKDLGIQEQEFKSSISDIAESAINDMCTKGNPKKVSKADVEQLLVQAYD